MTCVRSTSFLGYFKMNQGSHHMSQPFSSFVSSSWRPALLLGAALLLQACAAPKAVDIADNWKPVNTLAAKPQEIPLKEEADLPRFQMLPTDATLRHMLERWARENGGTLDWQYPSDLTLVSGLESVKDNNLQRALNSVRRSYAAQKLRIQVSASRAMLVTRMP